MKLVTTIIFLFLSASLFSQQDVHLKDGFAAEGYDVVAYYNDGAMEGNENYISDYQGVKYKFSSESNQAAFLKNPEMYIPAYGGYCAYAIADDGKKVGINPKTYKIIDGKLYLFYNSWGANTLKKWNKEGSAMMKEKADTNWKALLN
ncbi:YHS domain-containing (seleno)protein [Ulvibacter antarcticus]|uniref:YHS domain-containing protein n=1 Tax=Ulvibacter antarcticus TaxID=442714 RepID=A0A3L9Z4H0_9FLAO|nr:YHS domain-containing (seleno)protein [Ulvibacter antarcticus]RMA66349.1 YHS domain-containing protein [Ulvibacter antarcticus]